MGRDAAHKEYPLKDNSIHHWYQKQQTRNWAPYYSALFALSFALGIIL